MIDEPISIPLTRGLVSMVDFIDRDLEQHKWYAGKNFSMVYASRWSNGKQVRMHRIILERILGRELRKGDFADHKNGDTLDNRRANIRLASPQENQRNKSVSNKTTYKGVYRCKNCNNRWTAKITIQRKSIYLGIFLSPEEAHQAYCQAATKYFGEFARFE